MKDTVWVIVYLAVFKNQPPTLLERATVRTASANHTQERPSVNYIIVEAYMVLIGGNRDSFRHHASKYEYALGLSLCLVAVERTEKYSFRKRESIIRQTYTG